MVWIGALLVIFLGEILEILGFGTFFIHLPEVFSYHAGSWSSLSAIRLGVVIPHIPDYIIDPDIDGSSGRNGNHTIDHSRIHMAASSSRLFMCVPSTDGQTQTRKCADYTITITIAITRTKRVGTKCFRLTTMQNPRTDSDTHYEFAGAPAPGNSMVKQLPLPGSLWTKTRP
jgi:hypothetical protein